MQNFDKKKSFSPNIGFKGSSAKRNMQFKSFQRLKRFERSTKLEINYCCCVPGF